MADGLTLCALLPDQLDGMGEQARKKLCETEEIGCMKLAWEFIASELAGSLKSVLDCDLLKLLAKGWAEAEILTEFADPKKHPPSSRSVLEIGAHTLKREVHPVVAVTVGSLPSVELKFTLAVSAHFSGVKLSIFNAHIMGGRSGEAWVTGQLSYEGVPLHEAADSKKVPFPGTFAFEEPGVRIPRLESRC